MLVLTRKRQQQVRIGEHITLTILRIKGNTVRVGIEAPREIRVLRGELPPKERKSGLGLAQAAGAAPDRAPEDQSPTETGPSAEDATEPHGLVPRIRKAAVPPTAMGHAV